MSEKVIEIVISDKTYNPTLVEKIVEEVSEYLLTEDFEYLRCENGDFFIL